ncbi:MAG: hypothetical protein RIR55_1484 [Bacteroidota bacterium]|jgi:hypothetical protein
MYRRNKNIMEYYSEIFELIKRQILGEKDEYIIATPTEDLVSFYISKNGLNPIEFDNEKEESIEHKKYIKRIPAEKRDWGYRDEGDIEIEAEKLIVKLPVLPNNNLQTILQLNTQTISLSSSNSIASSGNYLIFELEIKGYGRDLNEDKIVSLINAERARIQGIIESKKNEINTENESLQKNLTRIIFERKAKLDSDNKKLSSIVNRVKIPLARKEQDVVNKLQIDKKPFLKRLKPKQPDEDYQLDSNGVLDILKLIENQCLQFEKTPKTYAQFGEESLRDQILANLNSVFEGKATGETFNNNGKTDIYLNIDKGNILVAECKFYGGKKLYHETIDQLLGYLTWRQNYGIMITFSKNSSFTKVVENAEGIIRSHSSFNKGFKSISNSHFISYHTLPTDEYKSVEIHHIYFDLKVK